MIREILSWLVVTCCGIPVFKGAHSLIKDYRTDKKAVKRAMAITLVEAMNKDWNIDTVWLYRDPVSAENLFRNDNWGWRACLICRHIYGGEAPADWKIGYSCLSSMEVHVIGYCDKHYAYLKPELDIGQVRCHCDKEAGIIHNFEEIIVEDTVN